MKNVIFDLGAVLIEWDPTLAFADIFTTREAAEAWLERIDFDSWNRFQDGGRSFDDGVAVARAAGLDEAVVQVGSDYVVTLGSRGFARVSRVMSAFDAAFLVAEPAAPVIAADAATDAPSADDDMREAASAFSIEDIRESAFRAAVHDEFGPGGVDELRTLLGKPATDAEFSLALGDGSIPAPTN